MYEGVDLPANDVKLGREKERRVDESMETDDKCPRSQEYLSRRCSLMIEVFDDDHRMASFTWRFPRVSRTDFM